MFHHSEESKYKRSDWMVLVSTWATSTYIGGFSSSQKAPCQSTHACVSIWPPEFLTGAMTSWRMPRGALANART
jgi:hypothetical protein